MNIGASIKNHRESKKLTRKDLSLKTGLSPGYIEEIESDKKVPSLKTLVILSSFFNVTISELLGEVPEALTPELQTLIENAKSLNSIQLNCLNEFLRSLKEF